MSEDGLLEHCCVALTEMMRSEELGCAVSDQTRQ